MRQFKIYAPVLCSLSVRSVFPLLSVYSVFSAFPVFKKTLSEVDQHLVLFHRHAFLYINFFDGSVGR